MFSMFRTLAAGAVGLVALAMTVPASPAMGEGAGGWAGERVSERGGGAADAAERILPSLVRVEYVMKFDGGQAPRTPGWAERCASCGRYHVQPGGQYIEDERPMEVAGYLISPTQVVTGDFFLQSRFLESVKVRSGDDEVSARPVAHAIDHYAMMLELERPLELATPLAFATEAAAPYRTVHWQLADARWMLEVKPLGFESAIISADRSERVVPVGSRGLVIDGEARPVGLAMNQQLPLGDSWKGSPAEWTWIDRSELEKSWEKVDADSGVSVSRVELTFRRGRPGPGSGRRWGGDDDEASVTERQALGVLVNERTMLVLASLNARLTGRLERITVHLPDGKRVRGEFVGSLRDYGALVIELNESQAGGVTLDREPIRRLGQQLLLAGEIELHGENRITRFGHTRIASYDYGWRRNVYPSLPGDTDNLFLFNTDGSLVALPLVRRKAATEQSRYSRERPTLTATAQIAAVLDDLEEHLDPGNVPLNEEDELRLAWLGVEMQELDEELARLYNVSAITDDGDTGAMVLFVYENSPAALAGIQAGDLLLRIHSDRRPRPLDVQADEDRFAMWGGFPWEHYDEMPEEYYDEMPTPWPTAENWLNRALTDIGFGAGVQLEIHREGEAQMLEISVSQSPTHYRAAGRHRDEAIGMTLSDMTYEVRRYFQKSAEDPGLVISRIESGSRASVAGLKPYEIITHINDEPLHTVKDFERAIKGQTDLRLSVERMHRTRAVRLSRPAEAGAEGSGEGEGGEVIDD